ncbi:FAD-dependent oxidoreductase [Humisphaera borealis]|uniref:FAD-dependent oxidoreductase n=1 Tax=Humisphaera borealis TaxID=2807512 RepID=A0A7M2X1T3_9BACT|nr:FAD-dependent oxidoreductase [Humisphaera borealis]QOV91663.1 FAD-dependent oxidoreductase [Humisphaera borealis]
MKKVGVIGAALIVGFTTLAIALSVPKASAQASASGAENVAGDYDLIVYGGTSGGVAAAVQARRMGRTVVVIEPTQRLGGLSSGGLGQTDIGNKAAIGGIAREFYRDVKKRYMEVDAWKWQQPSEYKDGGQTRTDNGEDTMWTFEPSVALRIYNRWVRDNKIPVAFGERLNRKTGVQKDGGRITAITMESGKTFAGKMFIDATYEGDLLAAAGVSYTVGREANAQYGETLNGVQVKNSKNHQLKPGIDPYVVKGDKASGLLPHIDPNGPGEEGAADKRVQAYCFRMCLTDKDENRIPFHKPEGYVDAWYELMLRNFEAGETGMAWINSSMPNRKTDTNNRTGFSTDFIGQNYAYPEASYEEREKIVAQHRLYQQGLMWTLANHPRVPEKMRREFARWGMCKDEFNEDGVQRGGWQEQLYVREARRMVGAHVMTQSNCVGKEVVPDAVGMGAYGMDSHNQQRYVDAAGHVRNEGNVEVGVPSPYPISYRSLTPKKDECQNLLVPICLSASHIAYGSIRMEPVFMVLGQTCATAAIHAIEDGKAVQDVDYAKLRTKLLEDKQVLEWTGKRGGSGEGAKGIDIKSLPGVVVDDDQAKLEGDWTAASLIGPFVATGYRHDANDSKGKCSATFQAKLPAAGKYEVRVAYSQNRNRATNVPVKVAHAGGETEVKVDQRQKAKIDGVWQSVGEFEFAADKPAIVVISNAGTDGFVLIDAVQFVAK